MTGGLQFRRMEPRRGDGIQRFCCKPEQMNFPLPIFSAKGRRIKLLVSRRIPFRRERGREAWKGEGERPWERTKRGPFRGGEGRKRRRGRRRMGETYEAALREREGGRCSLRRRTHKSFPLPPPRRQLKTLATKKHGAGKRRRRTTWEEEKEAKQFWVVARICSRPT